MRKTILKNITIEQIAPEGKGIARQEGKVLFISKALPGDVVDVRLTKQKKDFALGEVVALQQASSDRIEPFCSHFGICGGCTWQIATYENQLEYKQTIVDDAFKRVGKLAIEQVLPIVGANETTYYRNKTEYSFSNRAWLTDEQIKSGKTFNRNALGFHIPKRFEHILHIEKCYLQNDFANTIRNAIYQFAIDHNMSFYNVKFHDGNLRNLLIRNTSLNEWMLLLSFGETTDDNFRLLEYLKTTFPEITSLNYAINTKKNDAIYDLAIKNYSGNDFIVEQLGSIKYKIGVKSFFQTNTAQAKKLYDLVLEFGQFTSNDVVYDLYTGTGSIALYVASYCKRVIGIEQIPEAIVDANFNATMNQIDNCTFWSGTVETILDEAFIAAHGKADKIIVDPPRAGLHPKVIEVFLQDLPPQIVYVSCNPVTQARDIAMLAEKYAIVRSQAIDLFPHTYHIENVVLLQLK